MIVSFVTINYNNAEGLENTLAALLRLKERVNDLDSVSLELVVIDGLSGPEDQVVLERYRSQIDVLRSEKDDGIYDAMNKGIRLAGGDFVNFMNSGDVPVVENMARMIEVLKPAEGYYFARGRWSAPVTAVRFVKDRISRFWLKQPNHQAMYIPLDWHKQNLYDTRYPVAADLDIKLKLNQERKPNALAYEVVECEPGGNSHTTSWSGLITRANEISSIARSNNGLLSAFLNWVKFVLSNGLNKVIAR